MNQHSTVTESISLYMPSRSTHSIQSMALGINNAGETTDNNSNLATVGNNNYFSEIQMDDGKWTRHQTQILIDTWKEHKDILLSTASSSAEHFRVWKLIATEVNKFAPPKSLQQCKKKFRNIRYICKMAMNNNKQEGGKKHYPMFYSDFLEIIAETERIKEGIKNESPIEVLNDSNKELELFNVAYNNTSPREESQYDIRSGRSSTELVMRRSEDEGDERKPQYVTGVSTTSDGSYNGSPQSREAEDYRSSSPILQRAPSDVHIERQLPDNIMQMQNGMAENENGHSKIGERLSNYYYQPLSSELSRKHKNIDVSIMGHGYPPAKRTKKTMDFYPPHAAPYKYSPRSHRGYPPTMATISGNSYPYALNNHFSTTPPLIRSVSTPKDTAPSPRYITTTTGNLAVASNEPLCRDVTQSRDDNGNNAPLLKGSPKQKNNLPNKNVTLNESLSYYNQRFLDIQERQTELFSEMLSRHEQFLSRLLQQQREAAEEAQKRDREFMLKLIEMFVKH